MLSGMVHDGVYTLYLPISGQLRSYYETLVLRLPHRTDPQKTKHQLPNLINEGDSRAHGYCAANI